jgi:hypothetical protein
MNFMRLITVATALLVAPVAHASTLYSDTGTVSFDSGALSFAGDSFSTHLFDIIVSLSGTGELNDPSDFDFALSSPDDDVFGRALSISSVFDAVGEDSITLSFTPTTDDTGTYPDPFWVVLTGQFGTGFDAFTVTDSGFATVETVEPLSEIPLPASMLLLAAALGVLRLRRRT